MITTHLNDSNVQPRRARPERVQLLNCRIEHLTIVLQQPAAAVKDRAPADGQTFYGLDALRSAMTAAKDADLDRERAKLVTAIARRAANGAAT